MYAIIEDSGTQIKVQPGDVLDIDRRDAEQGQTLTFDRVLAVGDAEKAEPAQIGTPYLDGAAVTAEVLGERKGEKIDVVKFKRRKSTRRKVGHRQKYLRIRVGEIKS